MMSEIIRNAIKAKLETVITAEVGKVHAHERYSKSHNELKELFTLDKVICGFFIRRVRRQETIYTSTRNKVATTWEIRGYASFIDEEQSEIKFDNLIDDVAISFRNDNTLGGIVENLGDDATGIQLEDSGPVLFASILCHGVRLSLTTNHYEEISDQTDELQDFNSANVKWDIPPHNPEIIDAVDNINLEE
ncbi:MAG: hypothetical protein AB7U85_04915 [Alphaproteobacteria bacterium]